MRIPNRTLVVVADGRKMLLLRNEGDVAHPNLAVVTHDQQENPSTRVQGAAPPGRSHASVGPGRSAYGQTDFHELEEERFAAGVADIVNRRALANGFDRLIVIAPPRTLGELRPHWHKETQSRLLAEIAKEATNLPAPDIERLIEAA